MPRCGQVTVGRRAVPWLAGGLRWGKTCPSSFGRATVAASARSAGASPEWGGALRLQGMCAAALATADRAGGTHATTPSRSPEGRRLNALGKRVRRPRSGAGRSRGSGIARFRWAPSAPRLIAHFQKCAISRGAVSSETTASPSIRRGHPASFPSHPSGAQSGGRATAADRERGRRGQADDGSHDQGCPLVPRAASGTAGRPLRGKTRPGTPWAWHPPCGPRDVGATPELIWTRHERRRMGSGLPSAARAGHHRFRACGRDETSRLGAWCSQGSALARRAAGGGWL